MKPAVFLTTACLCVPLHAAMLDLSSEWRLALDADDRGLAAGPDGWRFPDTIVLPNTLATAGKGAPLEREPALDRATMQHLHPRFSHLGPAWFQREIDIPADWAGRDAVLTLERVLWESRVWINGVEAGMHDSLSTPHRHDVGHLLDPGKPNTLTIRIDNRRKIDIGIGHAYSTETQTIWNGIVGSIRLEALPKARVATLRARPDESLRKLHVTARMENTGSRAVAGKWELTLSGPDGTTLATQRRTIRIPPGGMEATADLVPEGAPPQWCEFSPGALRLVARIESDAGDSETATATGFRRLHAEGRGLFVNGRPVFLRGTLECCIFPKTGHPDMDGAEWEKIMRAVRDHGLNHIRFHSWCPPRAAFDAADRHGIYLQVELPNWSFHMGRRPEADAFFRAEGERIFREFGNHPSFVLFCLGNELTGDFGFMDRMVAEFKQLEPDLLMTTTAFSFSERGRKPGPADGFFISQETTSGWVRGQGFINQTRPNTAADYRQGLSSVNVPLVTHEVGQYHNFPNLAELPKYEDGALRALAYEAIRDDLAAKRMLDDAPRLTRDSGKLAALLYKEDMERALRTPELAGIQLLDLHDFPGQSTATVGILDAFWDSKGFISAENFRRFAGPTVPLARMDKLVWESGETMRAAIGIAHFGDAPLHATAATWTLTGNHGRTVAAGSLPASDIPLGNAIDLGEITIALDGFTAAEPLRLEVALPGTDIANDWTIHVYPNAAPAAWPEGVLVLDSAGPALNDALAAGKSVLLLPPRAAVANPIDARFIPVFWSPLHFPNQPGTLGATIDPQHPVFHEFPTSTHTDWHWWELFSTSFAMDLGHLPQRPAMPLRFIDKFDRNALPAAIWEAKAGPGKLLVCTLDLESELDTRPAARQLRASIANYLTSGNFAPAVELPPADIAAMFREVRFRVTASGAHDGHRPDAAVDGDPSTFWHTDWQGGAPQLPGWLALDLGAPEVVSGLRYTPRQDMNRGRIDRFRVDVSHDGTSWHPVTRGRLPDNRETRTIALDAPLRLRHIRLIGLDDHGNAGSTAIAELEPVVVPAGDVRDLGIIPGFNDGD